MFQIWWQVTTTAIAATVPVCPGVVCLCDVAVWLVKAVC
jgi:hypothetical protein